MSDIQRTFNAITVVLLAGVILYGIMIPIERTRINKLEAAVGKLPNEIVKNYATKEYSDAAEINILKRLRDLQIAFDKDHEKLARMPTPRTRWEQDSYDAEREKENLIAYAKKHKAEQENVPKVREIYGTKTNFYTWRIVDAAEANGGDIVFRYLHDPIDKEKHTVPLAEWKEWVTSSGTTYITTAIKVDR